jgi:hypothetical protein
MQKRGSPLSSGERALIIMPLSPEEDFLEKETWFREKRLMAVSPYYFSE